MIGRLPTAKLTVGQIASTFKSVLLKTSISMMLMMSNESNDCLAINGDNGLLSNMTLSPVKSISRIEKLLLLILCAICVRQRNQL